MFMFHKLMKISSIKAVSILSKNTLDLITDDIVADPSDFCYY